MATFNFPPTSRYAGIETKSLTTADGQVIVYLSRRFVPSPDSFALLFVHTVKQGDRLDNIAAQYLDDPEAFWRIADANGAMRPEALTETPGRQLRITLPAGIPAPANAYGTMPADALTDASDRQLHITPPSGIPGPANA